MNAARSRSRDKPLHGLINDPAHDIAGDAARYLATRLNAALLLRAIACKARKMRFEARHGEIHECADLRNGKPTLWRNKVQGHRGGLVAREKDLQPALRKLLSNVVGEQSGDATSFNG